MQGFGLIFDADHKRPLTPRDFERAGINGRLRDASLDQIPRDAHYRQRIEWYISNLDENIKKGVGLILYGPHGSGKSCGASIIAQEVMARGGSVLFIEEAMLLDVWIKDVEFPFVEDKSYRNRVSEVDLLIVDDLGLSPFTDNFRLTEEIIKFRLRLCRSVIIVTNLTKDKFVERYTTIADASREACIPVKCEGVHWRDIKEKELRARFAQETELAQ